MKSLRTSQEGIKMYKVSVNLLDIRQNTVTPIYLELFTNIDDATSTYMTRVNCYALNRDCTVEYDIMLTEICDNVSELVYRTIIK